MHRLVLVLIPKETPKEESVLLAEEIIKGLRYDYFQPAQERWEIEYTKDDLVASSNTHKVYIVLEDIIKMRDLLSETFENQFTIVKNALSRILGYIEKNYYHKKGIFRSIDALTEGVLTDIRYEFEKIGSIRERAHIYTEEGEAVVRIEEYYQVLRHLAEYRMVLFDVYYL